MLRHLRCAEWNESQIRSLAQRSAGRPNLLTYYVHSVTDRFITGQDLKTVKKRTAFLQALVEELKVKGEGYTLARQLERLRVEEEIKDMELQMRRHKAQSDLDSQSKIVTEQQQLDDLKRQRDRLQVEVEISNLQSQVREAEGRKSEQKLSPEKERAKNRAHWQKELARLRKEKDKALKNAQDEDEQMRLSNMYDDAIQRAMEQLSKHL
jgi:hypothetical protein